MTKEQRSHEYVKACVDAKNGYVQSAEYHHLLVNLIHADRLKCMLCDTEFNASDKVTRCPNSTTHSHSLIPANV